jgi:hypothetical protein
VQPFDSKEVDFDFSLEDLETIKVIGKGSGGVVQLVRHKWAGSLFALKVIVPPTIFLIFFFTFSPHLKSWLFNFFISHKSLCLHSSFFFLLKKVNQRQLISVFTGYPDEYTRRNS